jgi:hypothetical protein
LADTFSVATFCSTLVCANEIGLGALASAGTLKPAFGCLKIFALEEESEP